MKEKSFDFFEDICEKIADSIQESIKKVVGTEKGGNIVGIGADGKPTKFIDYIAESAALETLEGEDICLISEESGTIKIGDPEFSLILDPIDGTYNAVKDIPFYSTSIAVCDRNLDEIFFGYVKDFPNENTFYSNCEESFLNDDIILPSEVKTLSDASISYYGYGTNTKSVNTDLKDTVSRLRTFGCISLELCYVASGKLDGLIDMRGSKIVDTAAGVAFLKGCGAKYESIPNAALSNGLKENNKLIASNGLIHEDLRGMVENGA